MWLQALTAAGGWVFEIFKGKQEITKTKVEGQIKRINDWETTMAKGSQSSWKDEFWTVVLAVPMILCFFPDMVPQIKTGFDVLKDLPEWYRWSLMLSIGASFGFRGFDKFTFLRKNR